MKRYGKPNAGCPPFYNAWAASFIGIEVLVSFETYQDSPREIACE